MYETPTTEARRRLDHVAEPANRHRLPATNGRVAFVQICSGFPDSAACAADFTSYLTLSEGDDQQSNPNDDKRTDRTRESMRTRRRRFGEFVRMEGCLFSVQKQLCRHSVGFLVSIPRELLSSNVQQRCGCCSQTCDRFFCSLF